MADIGHVTDASYDVLNSDLQYLLIIWQSGGLQSHRARSRRNCNRVRRQDEGLQARHRRQWRNTPQVWDPRHSTLMLFKR